MADITLNFPAIRPQQSHVDSRPEMNPFLSLEQDSGNAVLDCDAPRIFAERELDQALLAGLRAGEEAAYESLVLRFEHTVYGIVSRMTDDPADAADVVQDVFLKVFRKINGFRAESSLKTWIFRIAINEARNHRRWFGRHRAQEVGLDLEPASQDDVTGRGDWLEDPGQSPFEITLDHEMQGILQQALSTLSPIHRAVVVLRDIEGLSYEEVGEVLDVPPGTVRSRMVRAREALRKELLELTNPSAAKPSSNAKPSNMDALSQQMLRVGGSEAL